MDGLHWQLRLRALLLLRSRHAFSHQLERCEPGQILVLFAARAGRLWPAGGATFCNDGGAARTRPGRCVRAISSPSPGDADAARAFLGGLKPGTRLVAIHPGSGGESKNWPKESWAELGRPGHGGGTGARVASGRRRSRRGVGAVSNRGVGRLCPHLRAAGCLSADPGCFLREASLFLGHDSGITHLAAASRRDLPVIPLFGPTDPAVVGVARFGCALAGDAVLKNMALRRFFGRRVHVSKQGFNSTTMPSN